MPKFRFALLLTNALFLFSPNFATTSTIEAWFLEVSADKNTFIKTLTDTIWE
jgi:hypothetical protein